MKDLSLITAHGSLRSGYKGRKMLYLWKIYVLTGVHNHKKQKSIFETEVEPGRWMLFQCNYKWRTIKKGLLQN